MYPHRTVPDQHTAKFTIGKEYLILKIQSEFVNGSDISESIRKGVILYLSKEIPIKRILTEGEPNRVDLENEYFKEVWNIQILNHVKKKKTK